MEYFIGAIAGATCFELVMIAVWFGKELSRPTETPEQRLARRTREAERQIAQISRTARALMRAEIEDQRTVRASVHPVSRSRLPVARPRSTAPINPKGGTRRNVL